MSIKKRFQLLNVRCKCHDCPDNDLGNGHWCKFPGDDPYGRRQPCKCMREIEVGG